MSDEICSGYTVGRLTVDCVVDEQECRKSRQRWWCTCQCSARVHRAAKDLKAAKAHGMISACPTCIRRGYRVRTEPIYSVEEI